VTQLGGDRLGQGRPAARAAEEPVTLSGVAKTLLEMWPSSIVESVCEVLGGPAPTRLEVAFTPLREERCVLLVPSAAVKTPEIRALQMKLICDQET